MYTGCVGAFISFVLFCDTGKCYVNFCVKHDLKAIELSGNVSSYFRGDIYR